MLSLTPYDIFSTFSVFYRVASLTCAEAVAKKLEEHGGDPPADYEYAQCDEKGNYVAIQCYGMWLAEPW